MKELGSRIRGFRKDKHLTIVDIARLSGIDQATLSRIENGKMTGTLASHKRIADALGCSLSSLYDVHEKSHSQTNKIVIRKLEKIMGELAEIIGSLKRG